MSAEVIAADLRLDLYTVNLATVVDKYVGETEKNLERIFAEAAGAVSPPTSATGARSRVSAPRGRSTGVRAGGPVRAAGAG